jgi:hypothetical protein
MEVAGMMAKVETSGVAGAPSGRVRSYGTAIPYYRRTLRDGSVAIFLRDKDGAYFGRVTVAKEFADKFESGKAHTIELAWPA